MNRPGKLPWIFPGAPLTFNGAPGNIQGNIDRYNSSRSHARRSGCVLCNGWLSYITNFCTAADMISDLGLEELPIIRRLSTFINTTNTDTRWFLWCQLCRRWWQRRITSAAATSGDKVGIIKIIDKVGINFIVEVTSEVVAATNSSATSGNNVGIIFRILKYLPNCRVHLPRDLQDDVGSVEAERTDPAPLDTRPLRVLTTN